VRRKQLSSVFSLSALFLAIEFFDELHYTLGGAALPALQRDFGLDYAQVGLLLGLPHFIGVLVEWFLMLLGDTRLRKALVVGGGLAVALAVILIGSGASFTMLLVGMALAFPASGAFVTLAQAALMDLHPGREPQMMARWTVFGSLGNLLGPLLLAGVFTLGLSWRWGYFSLAILALPLVGLVVLSVFPSPAAGPSQQPGGSTSWKLEFEDMLLGLVQTVKNFAVLRWLLLVEIADLLMDVFTSYAPLYFVNVSGVSNAQASLLLGVMMAGSLLSDLLVVPLLEHFPGRTLVRFSAVLAGIFFAAFLLVSWLPGKIVLAFLVKISTLGWYAIMKGEAYAAARGRSGAQNAVNSLLGVVSGAIPWLVGWTASQVGLQTAMWLLLAGPVALILWVPRAVLKQGLDV
jgi:FSR family fosmidomycin resistance protein-like MFS transporter